ALLAFRPSGLLGTSSSGAEPEAPARPVLTTTHNQRQQGLILAVLLAFGVVYPWLDQAAGWFRLPGATMMLLMVSLAVGLTIVVGFAGLLDLGYVAFFAIGSYSAALLTSSGSRIALALPSVVREPWLAWHRARPGDRDARGEPGWHADARRRSGGEERGRLRPEQALCRIARHAQHHRRAELQAGAHSARCRVRRRSVC